MSTKIIIRVPSHVPSHVPSRTRQSRTSDRVKELVSAFAADHCADTCKLFKASWNQWIKSGEIDSMLMLIHNRDETENKLFFSARYYHRKKTIKTIALSRSSSIEIETNPLENNDNAKEVDKTRAYNKTDRAILQLIDDHLAMLPNGPTGYLLKPSLAFDKFVALHGHSEYKKTYKNRFYMKETHILNRQ